MAGYQALGQWHEVTLISLTGPQEAQPALRTRAGRAAPSARVAAAAAPMDAGSIAQAVGASPVLSSRIIDPSALAVVQGTVQARPSFGARAGAQVAISSYDAITMVGQTVIAEGLRQADLAAAKQYGAAVIDEGLDGKTLLRVDSVDRVFGLIELLLQREVGSASPNFLRRVVPVPLSAAPIAAWSHAKIGVPAAWEITRGNADIRVAVLDEGVDTSHPSIKPAVFAERDFVGGHGNSAMPSGNDAHGTACAGIVLSRDKTFPGIAPGCSLIAARIAMDDGHGNWIFDDFSTAEAIDWSWRQGAAVLSNSWGGGAPSDAISRAFARARTQGRKGLGSVVLIAAGNAQAPIDFPGNLPGYVTVGASNPADERKTRTSSDGENWWGSNFGPTMHVLAPGVFIWTTDIAGAAGYDPGNFTKTFNGTSSATPAVAGAAALMLSANPALSASSVRDLLAKTAKKLKNQTVWTPELGWGRLDVAKAVAAAKTAGAPKSPAKPKTSRKAKTSKKAAKSTSVKRRK
jgi:subtilisin family serine protease